MSAPDDRMGHDDPAQGFEREAALVRSLADEPIEHVDAPDAVWNGIAAALTEEDAPSVAGDDRPVVLAQRRRPIVWLVAAAAAVAMLLLAGVIVTSISSDDPEQVASTALRPLDGIDVGDASAVVRLEQSGGSEQLDIEMDDLPAPAAGTFYELWLLSEGDGDPVSVASMKDPAPHVSTTVAVPPGTDTSRYRVVDVSVQHEGAGPAHSGESILRGTLTA